MGLLLVLAPFLSWIRISFGAFDASVNGFGMESSDDLGSSGSESSSATEDEDEDGFGWIFDPIPDGVVVSGLAGAVGALGLALRSWSDGAASRDDRRKHLTWWWLVLGLSAVGFLWVAGSWFRLDAEWDRQVTSQIGDEPFAALFLGGLEFEPGYGLILSGVGFVALGVAALLVVVQERKLLAEPGAATSPWQPPGSSF